MTKCYLAWVFRWNEKTHAHHVCLIFSRAKTMSTPPSPFSICPLPFYCRSSTTRNSDPRSQSSLFSPFLPVRALLFFTQKYVSPCLPGRLLSNCAFPRYALSGVDSSFFFTNSFIHYLNTVAFKLPESTPEHSRCNYEYFVQKSVVKGCSLRVSDLFQFDFFPNSYWCHSPGIRGYGRALVGWVHSPSHRCPDRISGYWSKHVGFLWIVPFRMVFHKC